MVVRGAGIPLNGLGLESPATFVWLRGRGDVLKVAAMLDVVCGVIRDGNGRVLACRRGFDRHLGGLWEFPGGKVDEGERAEEALARELSEELGIAVVVGRQFDRVVRWTDGIVAIRLRAFWCVISKGEPLAIEHAEIRWCAPADLEGLEWAEADVPLLRELLATDGVEPAAGMA